MCTYLAASPLVRMMSTSTPLPSTFGCTEVVSLGNLLQVGNQLGNLTLGRPLDWQEYLNVSRQVCATFLTFLKLHLATSIY